VCFGALADTVHKGIIRQNCHCYFVLLSYWEEEVHAYCNNNGNLYKHTSYFYLLSFRDKFLILYSPFAKGCYQGRKWGEISSFWTSVVSVRISKITIGGLWQLMCGDTWWVIVAKRNQKERQHFHPCHHGIIHSCWYSNNEGQKKTGETPTKKR